MSLCSTSVSICPTSSHTAAQPGSVPVCVGHSLKSCSIQGPRFRVQDGTDSVTACPAPATTHPQPFLALMGVWAAPGLALTPHCLGLQIPSPLLFFLTRFPVFKHGSEQPKGRHLQRRFLKKEPNCFGLLYCKHNSFLCHQCLQWCAQSNPQSNPQPRGGEACTHNRLHAGGAALAGKHAPRPTASPYWSISIWSMTREVQPFLPLSKALIYYNSTSQGN